MKHFHPFLTVVALTVVALGSARADIVTGPGVSGRYIRVTNLNPYNRPLAIGEIEAFGYGTTPNMASGGLLSTNDYGLAFKSDGAASGYVLNHGATDRPVNNVRDSGGNTYNASGVGNYYIADIGGTQNVGAIRLWQRTDCCYDRLADFKVSLLADNGGTPGSEVWSREYGKVPNSSYAQINVFNTRTIRPGGPDAIGTEVQGTAGGRFIKVQNNGTANRSLAIGEIEAFLAGVTPGGSYDNANDVALASKGATWQSETGAFQHGLAGFTIDGLATGGAESIHRIGVGAELVIDLGQRRDVGTVRVWQRGDGCCQDRLQNFSVSLLDDDGTGNPGAVLYTGSYPGQPPTNSFASFTLPAFSNVRFAIEGGDTLLMDLDPVAGLSDKLQIGDGTGVLTIQPGATLDLRLLSMGGGTFDLIDASSIQGTFSQINLDTPTVDVLYDLSQLYTTGEITVSVPEPLTLALLGLAGAGLGGYIRRRRR